MKITKEWLYKNAIIDHRKAPCYSKRQMHLLTLWFEDLKGETASSQMKPNWFNALEGRELSDLRADLFSRAKMNNLNESENQRIHNQWVMVEAQIKDYTETKGHAPAVRRSFLKKIIDMGTVLELELSDDDMNVKFTCDKKEFYLETSGLLVLTSFLTYDGKRENISGMNLKQTLKDIINPKQKTETKPVVKTIKKLVIKRKVEKKEK